MDSLTLKHHHSFQDKNNRKATHSFALRPWFLSWDKKFENWKKTAEATGGLTGNKIKNKITKNSLQSNLETDLQIEQK